MDVPTESSQGTALLQLMEHRDRLDIIDRLRSQGISQFVDLPQIIVCGDQSSGKSSVLEAAYGLSFPAKDNLCTRFATELILRRSPSVGVNLHIIPDPDRTMDEKKRLEAFKYTYDVLDISRAVEDAKDVMGLNGNQKVFSTDILHIEVSVHLERLGVSARFNDELLHFAPRPQILKQISLCDMTTFHLQKSSRGLLPSFLIDFFEVSGVPRRNVLPKPLRSNSYSCCPQYSM
jgi:hypothetical protein